LRFEAALVNILTVWDANDADAMPKHHQAAMLLILLALWAAATVHYWGLPPVSAVRKLEKGRHCAVG